MSFNDTGAVLSSFLNGTAEGGKPVTPTGNDNPSTFGMSQQTVTLPTVALDPVNVTPSNSQGSEEPMVNPVIPPGDQLPPSEYASFNDTGAVLSSFLNMTAEGGKPVTLTTSAPIQTVMESGTTSISEVQTEETPTTTVTSDFPSTVTVEISEAPTTFTDSSATDGTMESSFFSHNW
nr:uncharacterized protein LOC113818069 [Penaeus vannamei]